MAQPCREVFFAKDLRMRTAGKEGSGLETPTGSWEEPLGYEVYSLGMPLLASLLRPPRFPRDCPRQPRRACGMAAPRTSVRRERWEAFLS
mmetsp:Transcript_20580/g.64558  ORF Transcript_20580/g.64558 Transcript_20580/m.64558 type:complete len:90 (-) Transcript_20580:39-308(-)